MPTPPFRIHDAAVQEERQRGKEKDGEGELAGTGANEDMPVEKILEAELAVEQKSDQGVDGAGTGGSSVSWGRGAAGSERSLHHPTETDEVRGQGGVEEGAGGGGREEGELSASGSAWRGGGVPVLAQASPVPPSTCLLPPLLSSCSPMTR